MAVLVPENQEFKQLMELAGWNQSETASRLKLSPASISDYITGKTTPKPHTLEYFRRVVNERQNAELHESESEFEIQKATGYEGMSKQILEAVFQTFAK